ncbi:hypothetical protein [Pseudomonas amygdali]|uniref:Uncharacterized protein n=2 Tax=Pseudomonas amygdali pv. lachrymans TaxID=53707 RepID=A0ABR5KR86_PSEAV|nr:hypothetical protein [Pseudomonas amygdali]AXH59625.1 hypothetical protein PLA107_030850 [Pseudomonas amygdali pv. lachrymans str. M301315]KPC17055.1 Uncharacterized protein AC499_0257 [Pseudomonas amygdali pv. lachrymans]KPC18014.1 Uncharacterized protein AC499_1216 [Pseudomonas amygdali pv. lachrymans]RMT06390.1 hypothetical protein ALP54_03544 [Pseudomonas amygdali pv. lachrymans]
MKKLSAVLLALGLMTGAAQAAQTSQAVEVSLKPVVISIEAKDFSSNMATLMGKPVTMTSGDLQKAPNQALCVIVDVNEVKSTISETLNYLSSTSVTVLPVSSDDKSVRAWVSYSRNEQKDPEVAVIDKDCSLATGLIATTTARQLIQFDWGVEKKIELLDGQGLSVTINNPSSSEK